MFEKQEGKCAICGSKDEKHLCVDHSHENGKIRKLLCENCNKGLGYFRDNPLVLENAINYLIETKEK